MILKACISLVPFFLESMGDEVNHIMTFISLNPRLFQSGNLIMTTVDVSTLPKFISVFNLLHHFFLHHCGGSTNDECKKMANYYIISCKAG
jgi:hypothetical protein